MPWTFAHPALVLPLRRACTRPMYFAALVTGSLMPDFNYYLSTPIPAMFGVGSHSLLGSAIAAWSLGMVCIALVLWCRSVFCAPLPVRHRTKVLSLLSSVYWPNSVPVWIAFLVCLALGAWSHVFWDSWTHGTGYFARLCGFDRLMAGTPIFRWLQHLSTLVGSACLLLAYWRAKRALSTHFSSSSAFWGSGLGAALLLLMSAIAAAAWGWSAAMAADSSYFWRVFWFRSAIAGAQILLALWLFCGAWITFRERTHRKTGGLA